MSPLILKLKPVADSRLSQIEAQKTVTHSKLPQTEVQKSVTISNGLWFKFKRETLQQVTEAEIPMLELRINAVNYKTLASYYFLKKCEVFEVYGSDDHPEAIINMDEMDMP